MRGGLKMKNNAFTVLYLQEVSTFLKISPQTIRKHLKNQGYLSEKDKLGNRYALTVDTWQKFIAKNYAVAYNSFVNRYLNDKRKESIMYPIPKGKGVISAEKQRSGNTRYYIRNFPLYCDSEGNIIKYRYPQGFDDKDEAKEQRAILIRDRDAGVYQNHFFETTQKCSSSEPSKNQSYYDFCINYFANKKCEEATRKLYIDITENRIKPFFGATPISELSKALLQRFVDNYTTNIRKTFIVLSLTLKKLCNLELIPVNYYDFLIKPTSTAPKRPKEALTVTETNLFLDYYKGKHLEHCILLLFHCGLRIGELQALQWDEIEFIDDERAEVHVNSSWGETLQGMARKEPKTKSSKRVVLINDAYTISVLKKAKLASKGNLWVAENKTGLRPIDKHNFTKRYFTNVGKILGFTKHLSSHVARHTFISHLVQNNVPYTEIAKLAGHDSTTMIINVYAHAIQDKEKVFDYVSNLYT